MIAQINWQLGIITDIRRETPTVRTFRFSMPNWKGHRAGQRCDVRLRAPDGYVAQRSYSIASSPEPAFIELTIERLDNGEVSTHLHDVSIVGDAIEIRGPIGEYFVWDSSQAGSLLLVGGGSGVAPLMSMLRHRKASSSTAPTCLLFSARSHEDLIYREELQDLAADGSGLQVIYTLTRSRPQSWTGYGRRIDTAMLSAVASSFEEQPQAYVCGPTEMVEVAAQGLLEIGIDRKHIRTERFGPSGS